MTNKSVEDYETGRDERIGNVNKVLNYILAFVFLIVGIVCLIRYKTDTTMIALGVVAIIYAFWKAFKGFKKR